MKANNTPGGFALGHATDDASGWVYWCLWTHGGNIVDKNDKVILNSPETEKALNFAKHLYDTTVPGVVAWNDASNNRHSSPAESIGRTTPSQSTSLPLKTPIPERLRRIWITPIVQSDR
jgi:ABC-type glycerol-3-phosphate transport system substrate-binding protein